LASVQKVAIKTVQTSYILTTLMRLGFAVANKNYKCRCKAIRSQAESAGRVAENLRRRVPLFFKYFRELCTSCNLSQRLCVLYNLILVLPPTTWWRFPEQGTWTLDCLINGYSILLTTLIQLQRMC